MNNFAFVNPVKILFGKGMISEITKEIPLQTNILVIYGGGSIKKNGVYEQVINALKGYQWFEFSGIEPNPHYETCMRAVEFIKQKNIEYVLAVGGGSVIDATKFIVAAACFDEGDPWRILADPTVVIKKALPFGTILTISATGSEMNTYSVITKNETQEKLSFSSPIVYPKFSILDPSVTYSLPPVQTSNGVIDAFVHVIEQYLTYPVNGLLQDFMSESILKTLIIEGPKALKDPKNYDVRANLMWASTWALNGWIACGVPQDWSTHMIGHELTAFYEIDHAQTLAIVLPGVMEVLKEEKKDKILRLGREVFSLQADSIDELIKDTISAVESFFHSMNCKTRLSDYNLGEEAIHRISERIEKRGWQLGEHQNIKSQEVKKILELRK